MSKEASLRALRHKAEQLATLAGIEAFDVLRRECERKRLAITQQLVDRILTEGVDITLMQRQVDYNKGFIAGMHCATSLIPSDAARMLQRLQEGVNEPEPEEDYWSYGDQPE